MQLATRMRSMLRASGRNQWNMTVSEMFIYLDMCYLQVAQGVAALGGHPVQGLPILLATTPAVTDASTPLSGQSPACWCQLARCMHVSVCLPACLPVSLSVCLYVCLFLSVCRSFCLSVGPSVCLSVPAVCLTACLSEISISTHVALMNAT